MTDCLVHTMHFDVHNYNVSNSKLISDSRFVNHLINSLSQVLEDEGGGVEDDIDIVGEEKNGEDGGPKHTNNKLDDKQRGKM